MTPIPISKLEFAPNSARAPKETTQRIENSFQQHIDDSKRMARIEKLIFEGFESIKKDIGDLKKHVDDNFFLIDNRLKFLDARVYQILQSRDSSEPDQTPQLKAENQTLQMHLY